MRLRPHLVFIGILLMITTCSASQKKPVNMRFFVSMESAANHYYHVVLECSNLKGASQDFKMCAWTPGFYQILGFAKAVENFRAADGNDNNIQWEKAGDNTWRVYNPQGKMLVISYDIKATVPFVGNVYLDTARAYITPGGLFMYLDSELHHPVTIEMHPFSEWKSLVATGLDSVPNKKNTFYAADFDVLYDSPFLMGKLESLPSFKVKNIPHYFIGYRPGDFDRAAFMEDLKKIVTTGSNIIGDIPYTHYSFLYIGNGGGGIEHLNSSSLSYNNTGLNNSEGRKRLYNFIAHEYFHHYNVKRIRPVELGPFDYSKENRTNMLWVSEGFTVYYEYLICRRAGLTADSDILKSFSVNIRNYENKPGHLYQSATQSSYDTWSDNPFGKSAEQENKTISYYDKGPVLALMIDFAIRDATKNNKSLDDVMRLLYRKYYQTLKRGFTEAEFKMECEKMATVSLEPLFEYAATVKEPDYPKYFVYGGLSIDTSTREVPGPYLGIAASQKDSIVTVRESEWNSPAWIAGIRKGDIILAIEDQKATTQLLEETIKNKPNGSSIKLLIGKDAVPSEIQVAIGIKHERKFNITPIEHPSALQQSIYKSWVSKR